MSNRLRDRFESGKPSIGFWAGTGSAVALESMCQLPVDWILIDCEHGAMGYESAVPLLQAMTGFAVASMIRVPSPDRVAIARVCDMGVEGVLVPQVRAVSQVEEAVAATRYPPAGRRGIGPWRAGMYGSNRDVFATDSSPVVVVQVETLGAVEQLDAILAVDGLDGVLIGPADMSAALGCFPDMKHPDMQANDRKVVEAAERHGKIAGYYCDSGKEAAARIEQGFRMVSICSDFGGLMKGLRREIRAVNGE